jgi:hypothetical protein
MGASRRSYKRRVRLLRARHEDRALACSTAPKETPVLDVGRSAPPPASSADAPRSISRRALDAHQAMRVAGASAAALALLGLDAAGTERRGPMAGGLARAS